ncbi:cyclic AMP-responsive element-binding protein 3-like protein 3-B [Trichomycterus rosablanca]|uniref:cyclic AMP-responsive element-binding protein 3-like protein 3-B n=1 Tax=Trichomycterus rosablanca TaxID=2290929 RepID=UPI002F353B8B
MALLSNQSSTGLDLLDLLSVQADGKSNLEGPEGDHANPVWLFPDQSFLCHHDDANNFLDSLLDVCESASGSSSPLWAPSPCDSGISEDPTSDHLDSSPLIPNLLFDMFFFPQNQQPFSPPYHQAQVQPQHGRSARGSADPVVSIDVDLESHLFSYKPIIPQCVRTSEPATDSPVAHQLSVKDLLLSNLKEPPKPPSQNSLQELVLNDDEKRLLAKEGVSLPSQLPLTKHEEKILKKVRRKIRNKQSAQESRKKKKEYLDSLEGRMNACSAQNVELQRKVIQLEKTNMSLMEQLRRLQALIMKGSNRPAQTGMCILVLVLSFSLILLPSLQTVSHSRAADPADISTARVQSRSLRSVMDVHDMRPAFSMDRPIEITVISKLHIRPEYADMNPLRYNRSHGNKEHHHGDPITGHIALLGWS